MVSRSIIITFVSCILFNVLLPTADVGSDLNFMYLTLTFNLGDSIELQGCKTCYQKTEKQLYHSETNLSNSKCKICLYNKGSFCGLDLPVLKKMIEWEGDKETCMPNETFRFTHERKFEDGECKEEKDKCCISRTKQMDGGKSIQKLDPNKLVISCKSFTSLELIPFHRCLVAGTESSGSCAHMWSTAKSRELPILAERLAYIIKSSTNDSVFLYPYSWINKSFVIQENSVPITEPNIKCGLLIFLNKINNSDQEQSEILNHNHVCKEDTCLTHLKALKQFASTITNLTEWRKSTDYITGARVGGSTCRILQIYGASIGIPILLNFVFNIVLFVSDFRENKAMIVEILPLFLLFYPQYKSIKFLAQYIFAHHDESLLIEEKKENDCKASSLEPYLESSLQVHIALAIMFANETFYPRDDDGNPRDHFKDFNETIPFITVLLSLFSSSFGMSKFFLAGPIQFLSEKATVNGLFSISFLCLCLINSMFGFRIVCLESALFTTYRYEIFDNATISFETIKQITPIIPPEYRLLAYLSPCIVPFMINISRLWCTPKATWAYFMKYPQFLVSPCFTPFMFEGHKSDNPGNHYNIRIWKLGSVINAIYIGCLPQCILFISDYCKGVHHWKFGRNTDTVDSHDDALFKHEYGNTIFAATTALLFLLLIAFFFGIESMINEKFSTVPSSLNPMSFVSLPGVNNDFSESNIGIATDKNGENIIPQMLTEKAANHLDIIHTELDNCSQHGEYEITQEGDDKILMAEVTTQLSMMDSEVERDGSLNDNASSGSTEKRKDADIDGIEISTIREDDEVIENSDVSRQKNSEVRFKRENDVIEKDICNPIKESSSFQDIHVHVEVYAKSEGADVGTARQN